MRTLKLPHTGQEPWSSSRLRLFAPRRHPSQAQDDSRGTFSRGPNCATILMLILGCLRRFLKAAGGHATSLIQFRANPSPPTLSSPTRLALRTSTWRKPSVSLSSLSRLCDRSTTTEASLTLSPLAGIPLHIVFSECPRLAPDLPLSLLHRSHAMGVDAGFPSPSRQHLAREVVRRAGHGQLSQVRLRRFLRGSEVSETATMYSYALVDLLTWQGYVFSLFPSPRRRAAPLPSFSCIPSAARQCRFQ